MITKIKDWQRSSLDSHFQIEKKVTQMLCDIKQNGDTKIIQLAKQFDQQAPKVISLKPFAEYQLKNDLASSIKLAAQRIEKFAQFQMKGNQSRHFADEFGTFGQTVTPIERVGAYIPGGRYPLISTALMTLIPAKVAGCPIRIACSPSDNPAVLAAASLAGATSFIQLGGVQAMAALAYGYAENTPVDLIVGPGNAWVNEAKKQLQSQVKIDGLAGPSELLALCDNEQPIEWLALDALAQAEHDPMACSFIVSDDRLWLNSMAECLQNNQQTLSLIQQKQIQLIEAQSTNEMVDFSERYAPEHLMLCHKGIQQTQLTHYGSLFIGASSAVALGDYITGPNHTLPTQGYAKQTGGLSIHTFLKINTLQQLNLYGRKMLAQAAMPLAQAEGLNFHFESLKIRC